MLLCECPYFWMGRPNFAKRTTWLLVFYIYIYIFVLFCFESLILLGFLCCAFYIFLHLLLLKRVAFVAPFALSVRGRLSRCPSCVHYSGMSIKLCDCFFRRTVEMCPTHFIKVFFLLLVVIRVYSVLCGCRPIGS